MSDESEQERPVVLVTGAGRGIGRTYARAFLDAGHPVALADVVDDIEEVAAAEGNAGGRAMGIWIDVADERSVADAVSAIGERLGPPQVLVNNAALFANLGFVTWDEIDVTAWDRVMAVNVRGPFLCASACLPGMIGAGWGRIVNISSTTVMLGGYRRLHYATSKAAVIGFTRALAREVGDKGITVNAVAPGSTESSSVLAVYPPEIFEMATRLRSIPRSQVPEDLVGAVMFLASDAAAFITGQTIVVDGGHVMQ